MRERKCGVQDCLVGRHGRAEVQGVLTKGLVCADHSQLRTSRETRLDGNEKKMSDAGLASNLARRWRSCAPNN